MSKTARGKPGLSPRLCLRLAEPNDVRDLELLFEGLVGSSKRGRPEEIRKAIKHKEIIVATIPIADTSRQVEHLVGFVHGIVHNDPLVLDPYCTSLHCLLNMVSAGEASGILYLTLLSSVASDIGR